MFKSVLTTPSCIFSRMAMGSLLMYGSVPISDSRPRRQVIIRLVVRHFLVHAKARLCEQNWSLRKLGAACAGVFAIVLFVSVVSNTPSRSNFQSLFDARDEIAQVGC